MNKHCEDVLFVLLLSIFTIAILSALYFAIFLDAFWSGNWGGFVEVSPGRIDRDVFEIEKMWNQI